MFLHLIHCLGKDKEKRGLAELQTYAITSYPSVDSIKFVVSAMHRGQHNYDNPKINVRILISANYSKSLIISWFSTRGQSIVHRSSRISYSGQFLNSRVIGGLENVANSIIRE